ncbi:hypothetical protein AEST_12930 [Alishewanella aestuarii B11]|uniref:Uncharacterized protein n=1 Tax=Alishewanella aestuarii B11 TaxID=1197174 RepID=J1QK00_9ALTE|nr:hypothetical protein AEST_12930 [Alishewanella aestuarii B11]
MGASIGRFGSGLNTRLSIVVPGEKTPATALNLCRRFIRACCVCMQH